MRQAWDNKCWQKVLEMLPWKEREQRRLKLVWVCTSAILWFMCIVECSFIIASFTCVTSVISCSFCVRRDCKRRSSPSSSVCFFFISWCFSRATCSECSSSRSSASYFSLTRFTLNTYTQRAHRMQVISRIFQVLINSINLSLAICIRCFKV